MNKSNYKERYVEPLDPKTLYAPQKERIDSNSSQSGLYTIEYPKTSLSSLIVPEETGKQIRSILTKIKYYDLLYNKFGLREIDKTGGRKMINFYGPPGTGKSFAAEANLLERHLRILRRFLLQQKKKMRLLFLMKLTPS